MTDVPLMPKATAVWLVDNTALSFDQIAEFCQLHPLEVSAIADGDTAQGIKGLNPITTGQLSREEIEKGQGDSNHRLKLSEQKVHISEAAPKRRKKRYTPISRRQDRPNAILWLVRNHPELRDAQISRIVGTTKSTIDSVRARTHWNSANLSPMDPVTLGLCKQSDLDLEVQKAEKYTSTSAAEEEKPETLLPVDETTSEDAMAAALGASKHKPRKEEEKIDADTVFAKLSTLKKKIPKES